MRTLHLGIAATVIGLGAAAFSVACDQPTPRCTITTLQFYARYTPKEGQPADCAKLPGESLFAGTYNPPVDPATAPFPGTPDVNTIFFGLKTLDIENRISAISPPGGTTQVPQEKTAYSYAKFDQGQTPKDTNICTGTFSQQTDVTFDAVEDDPETKEDDSIPKTRLQYEWSKFQIYVTAATTGVQFSADLVRTETLNDGTPTRCEYTVSALAPEHGCGTEDPNGDETYLGGDPDPTRCDPNGDLDAGRLLGSGISPDIDVSCDPKLLRCLPPANTPIPNLKASN
jgi:hypothetical protein